MSGGGSGDGEIDHEEMFNVLIGYIPNRDIYMSKCINLYASNQHVYCR